MEKLNFIFGNVQENFIKGLPVRELSFAIGDTLITPKHPLIRDNDFIEDHADTAEGIIKLTKILKSSGTLLIVQEFYFRSDDLYDLMKNAGWNEGRSVIFPTGDSEDNMYVPVILRRYFK